MKNYKLLLAFILLFSSLGANAEFRLGKDYLTISNPLPVKQDGVVEVLEIFWYGCGHCNNLEPVIANWSKKQDSSVKLTKMPVTWGSAHQLHAKLFYTIEALGIGEKGHAAVFTSIHKERNYLSNEESILQLLETFDFDRAEIKKQMNSFSVKQKLKRAMEITRQLKVQAVPMLFVDGQYKIEAKRSHSEMLEVADHVIALQKPVS
ncbi:thiol:disulfide interchange protein DsbA/DsbL [Gammaproteobacteria bacterium]|jgi:protein dithiol oxidoreductase (disulfide-forming)|nr:thiol:disulfide interchange protein DsbA/DsbL [Gammaproteobacteria bacterium]|tara:strand:- start:6720 stop:7337 length:618 start_codon:yes stop_codon:yes gene_type:complete